MAFGNWVKKQIGNFQEDSYYLKIGTEVLGRPSGMNGMGTPLERAERVKAGKKEAARRAREESYGTGGNSADENSYGDENWTPAVHGTTLNGNPVTVSFGQSPKTANQTLICDGHVSSSEFYAKRRSGKGHAHYLADGASPRRGDAGRYTDES